MYLAAGEVNLYELSLARLIKDNLFLNLRPGWMWQCCFPLLAAIIAAFCNKQGRP